MAQRRRRTVRARRRPARRSTRAGGARKTARRAYAPKRRVSRRRNPKTGGIMGTQAFRYATATAAGAAAEVVISQTGFLAKTFPNRMARSAVYALLTVMVGRQVFKGKARENLTAAAIGFMVPSLVAQVGTFQLGSPKTDVIVTGLNGNGNGNGNGITTRSVQRAITNNYSAARAHAAAGLKLA